MDTIKCSILSSLSLSVLVMHVRVRVQWEPCTHNTRFFFMKMNRDLKVLGNSTTLDLVTYSISKMYTTWKLEISSTYSYFAIFILSILHQWPYNRIDCVTLKKMKTSQTQTKFTNIKHTDLHFSFTLFIYTSNLMIPQTII